MWDQVFLRSGVLVVECAKSTQVGNLSHSLYITPVVTALRYNYGNCPGVLSSFVCSVFYV